MALTNPKIFGLNVESKLTDVKNKNTALQNIGINPLDLDIIRGSANEGMTRFDWISFSRLSVPLYKTLDRLNRESTAFSGILQQRAGIDQTLFGNLNINGSISGSAIRYRFIDFDDGNKTKIAENMLLDIKEVNNGISIFKIFIGKKFIIVKRRNIITNSRLNGFTFIFRSSKKPTKNTE